MRDIVKEKLHISWRLLFVILATLILGTIVLYNGYKLDKGKYSLVEQTGYHRYDPSGEFGQFSVFLGSKSMVTGEMIEYYRHSIENSLFDNGIEEENYTGRLYLDSYYAESKVTVSTDKGKSAEVKAMGVGGDFFYFHPLDLVSGYYFNEDFLNEDYILIDRECAWALFGATDVEGFWVNINGKLFVIAGVYDRPDDELNKIAGNETSTIYMSYNALDGEGKTPITCYEVIMPDPVKNFGMNMLKDDIFSGVECCNIICNSERYTYSGYFNVLDNKRARKMRTEEIAFPYWENIARDLEDELSENALAQWIAGGLLAIIYVVFGTAWIIRHKPDREDVERLEDWFGEKTRKKQ